MCDFLIAFILQSNNALRKLNLAYNGFADEGVGALAVALKLNSTLVELDVRYIKERASISYVGLAHFFFCIGGWLKPERKQS